MSLRGSTIGLIEDDLIMGESLVLGLTLEGCDVRWWKTGAEALSELPYSNASAVVCDIRLPDMEGSAVFRRARFQRRATPFLFMTAYGSVEQAVELLKEGAGDYLTKPFDMEVFLDKLDSLLGSDADDTDDFVLGPSKQIRATEEFLKQIARTAMPVLFQGETGVGKEVCARYLHSLSEDGKAPFMALNCAAIPPDLLERELLGAEEIGEDGAPRIHRGYAERAADGTLFLDEVDELPLGLQAKLLRFIEDNAFYRLGGQELIPMRCRIMCATLADLEEKISLGTFRRDLYFRISSAPVRVIALRDRPDDILWLADRFLVEQPGDERIKQLTPAAQQALLDHDWLGNVRELKNRIARGAAVAADLWISASDLFPDKSQRQPRERSIQPLSQIREDAEKKQIEFALKSKRGRISDAAKALGISRTTMWEKMMKYGIENPSG